MKQTNLKSGISTFQLLIVIILGYFFAWPYVEENFIYKDSPKYVVQFKNAIEDFSKQKETVKDVYKDALDAQTEAKSVKYVFKNDKTKVFVTKWGDAEREIKRLRETFDAYQENTENFLDGLEDNLEQIENDPKLKNRMQEYSNKKAIKMANNINKIEKNIKLLERSIQKGNNLIVALKTVSSFNGLAQDIEEFDSILDGSNKIFTDIDSLIVDGRTALDIELKE